MCCSIEQRSLTYVGTSIRPLTFPARSFPPTAVAAGVAARSGLRPPTPTPAEDSTPGRVFEDRLECETIETKLLLEASSGEWASHRMEPRLPPVSGEAHEPRNAPEESPQRRRRRKLRTQ